MIQEKKQKELYTIVSVNGANNTLMYIQLEIEVLAVYFPEFIIRVLRKEEGIKNYTHIIYRSYSFSKIRIGSEDCIAINMESNQFMGFFSEGSYKVLNKGRSIENEQTEPNQLDYQYSTENIDVTSTETTSKEVLPLNPKPSMVITYKRVAVNNSFPTKVVPLFGDPSFLTLFRVVKMLRLSGKVMISVKPDNHLRA